MHNITYMLAKAIQTDYLREAKQRRLARQIEVRRKKAQAARKTDK